jgi:DNA-binding PadR family transcriptional regulator
LLIAEIGRDMIDAASKLVDYMHDVYGLSKSSTWYCLKRLKEKKLVEFASKDEVGKPLYLTKEGIAELSNIEKQNIKNKIIDEFSNAYIQKKYYYASVDDGLGYRP